MATQTSSYPLETKNGTTTTWIALSTTHPVPQGCNDIFRVMASRGGIFAFDPNVSTLDQSYSCVPVAASNWWSQNGQSNTKYTTKLAIGPIVCPQDWVVVQSSTKDESSVYSMCCPTGYDRSDGSNAQAVVNIEGAEAFNTYKKACVSTVSPGRVLTLYDAGSTSTITTFTAQTTVFALGFVGMNVEAVTSSAVSSASFISTTMNQPIRTNSLKIAENTQTSESSEPTNMSAGVKAGIGIGAAVGAMMLVVSLVFLLLRWHKNHKNGGLSRSGKRYIRTESPEVAELDFVKVRESASYPHGTSVNIRAVELDIR